MSATSTAWTLDPCPACGSPVRAVERRSGKAGGYLAQPCGHVVLATIGKDQVVTLEPFVTDALEDDQPAIPGLEPAPRGASALEKATRQTIRALQVIGLVEERHAMVVQLMLDLAVVVDAGRRGGKAAAAAMAAAQLLAAYQLLIPEQVEGGGSDAFDELARDLREAGARALAEVQRSGAPVRDTPES